MVRPRKRRRATGPAPTNLPEVPSSFVGRVADIAAVTQRMEQGRLVTITGPGGMGKTRTALRVAQGRLASFSAHRGGGVWLCDLTEARTGAEILAVVAAAIGVRLAGSSDALVARDVGHAIARMGRVLLLLDNFDRLTSEAASTVGLWLAVAPQAHFLVTSRVPLDLPGEQLWPLQPLPGDEGAELFTRRACQVRPSFEATGSDREVVRQIVGALDGMPLAIELAATRMAVLSAAQLRERLGRPLEVLDAQGSTGRHASMRRTVLDSVELLACAEARAFAACAVFRNGFAFEAADAVLGGVIVERHAVLGTLEALVRRSLLRAVFSAGDDEARFAFFETVRDVAEELLAAEPAREELERRHVAHYAGLGRRLGREATIHSGSGALVRLGRDLENLVQAHAAALRPGGAGASVAVAIALGLDPLLSARGSSRLRLRLLDASVAGLPESPGASALTEALLARGLAWRELGELTLARADFERGLSLATRDGQPGVAAQALTRIGEIVDVAGSTGEARGCFARALELLREAPDDASRTLREAEAFVRMGHAHRREGQLEAAAAATHEATPRYRGLGNEEGLAGALYEAAVIAMFRGEAEAAQRWFDEGLRVARRAGVSAIAGALTTARGCLLQERGAIDQALAHHAEAARAFHELGSRYREPSALYYLATAYLERGDTRDAERVLRRARECIQGVGSPRYEALIDACRSCALAAAGDLGAARAVLADAERAGAQCSSEPALEATLQIHQLSLRLRSGEWREAESITAAARALATAHPSDDSRFALRVLLSIVGPSSPRSAAALVVWEEGRAFRTPHASHRVELPPRSPGRRILVLLASRRIDAPGDVVPVEEIIDAGWPGERIRPDAALNRAYVALATLRKLGLREALVTGAGGYCLDPAVAVRLASPDDR